MDYCGRQWITAGGNGLLRADNIRPYINIVAFVGADTIRPQ
jgi:hypothetical protein